MFMYSFGTDRAYAWTQHVTLIMISAQVCAGCLVWNNKKKKHEGNNNNQTGSWLFSSWCWIMWTWLDTPCSMIHDPGFCHVSTQEIYPEVKCWVELWDLGVWRSLVPERGRIRNKFWRGQQLSSCSQTPSVGQITCRCDKGGGRPTQKMNWCSQVLCYK